ncbi:MAG: SLC13 family permease [Spirochaetota bacterium]
MSFLNPKVISVFLFTATYLFIIFFYNKKIIFVWISVFILLLLGILNPKQALQAIDWNVILLYYGMLFVSEVFLFSKMPDYLATLFASRAKRMSAAMVIICAFTGFISIALENVAVVLLVAPIAMSISKKCDLNPIPLFIGMAVSSNLQGAATLIGDPPSMLLAGYAKLTFNDFFIFKGKPGVFFAIQIGALVSFIVLFLLFKKYNKKMPRLEKERYLSIVPALLVIVLITTLIVSSSIEHNFTYMTGLICSVFGLLSFIWYTVKNNNKNLKEFLNKLDWQTGLFLIGVFILVKSLSVVGILDDIAALILVLSGQNVFIVFLLIVWISVFISAFIDNVPFLMAMLPVIQLISAKLGINPYPLFISLLIGASIGGNITPVGASANIVAMGILRKNGYSVRFFDFVKIGFPFTIATVTASSFFIWFVFF